LASRWLVGLFALIQHGQLAGYDQPALHQIADSGSWPQLHQLACHAFKALV